MCVIFLVKYIIMLAVRAVFDTRGAQWGPRAMCQDSHAYGLVCSKIRVGRCWEAASDPIGGGVVASRGGVVAAGAPRVSSMVGTRALGGRVCSQEWPVQTLDAVGASGECAYGRSPWLTGLILVVIGSTIQCGR